MPQPALTPHQFEHRPEGSRTSLHLKRQGKSSIILAYIWRDKDGFYHAKDMQFIFKNMPKPCKFFYEFLDALCKAYAVKMRISKYEIKQG